MTAPFLADFSPFKEPRLIYFRLEEEKEKNLGRKIERF
jgi:hypothetical protein